MMKIKAYDKYKNQWLIIQPVDDKINIDSYSSSRATANVYMEFIIPNNQAGEDPTPERWSDLEKLELIIDITQEIKNL